MPLRLSNDGDVATLNRWARRIENKLVNLKVSPVVSDSEPTPGTTPVTPPVNDPSIPPMPTHVAASEAGKTINGILYSNLYCGYSAPNPKGSFAGIFLVAVGYKGSTTPSKIAESSFSGGAGGSGSFQTVLDCTGETITLYFVPKSLLGITPSDWLSCPSCTVVLDGTVSKPVPPRNLQLTFLDGGGIAANWDENPEPDVDFYSLYRNGTSPDPAGASKIADIPALHATTNTYHDVAADANKPYYYWLTATNTAAMESDKGPGVPINILSGGNGELLNPGFEKGLLCWTQPAGASWINDASQVLSGKGALRLSCASGDVSVTQTDSWGTVYRVPAIAPPPTPSLSNYYMGAASFRINVLREQGNGQIYATLKYFNANGTPANPASYTANLTPDATNVWSVAEWNDQNAPEWQSGFFEITFGIRNATTPTTVRFDNCGAGAIWVGNPIIPPIPPH